MCCFVAEVYSDKVVRCRIWVIKNPPKRVLYVVTVNQFLTTSRLNNATTFSCIEFLCGHALLVIVV